MNIATLKKSILIGVVATFVMTVVSFAAHHIHLPNADFHAVITAFLHTGAIGAWVIYFGVGIALAYFYNSFFRDKLPYKSWKRGFLYGLGLWLIVSIFVLPAAGMGVFAGSVLNAAAMLIAMAFYGATLGYMYEKH